MKRRRFMQALAAAPAAQTLVGQPAQTPSASAASATGSASPAGADVPALTFNIPEAGAEAVLSFFTPEEFAGLRKLSDILMPGRNGVPGALDAHAAEFLDFLIGASPGERQQVYRDGLKALDAHAKKRFGKPFAEIDSAEVDPLLAPLRAPWTYEPPADPLARFLWAAKDDVRTATINSREWSLATPATGRRPGRGLYWLPID